ncbi:hypothetical protein GCM10010256_30670 [Streptomyces coeruleorubidus]|nr:hypothetical protein GCM10010256_30670 [Streptomyces coeruleorubidus]
MKLSGNILRAVGATTCAAALTVGMSGQAMAAPSKLPLPSCCSDSGGYAEWNPDPYNGLPGDSVRVCDTRADDWAVEASLDTDGDGRYDDRTVSTRGHSAGYCSGWASGDLPENIRIGVFVSLVKGTAGGTNKAWSVSTSA